MKDKRVLVTGATGQVGLPVAKALAKDNEVWAAARFKQPAARDELEAAGVRCAPVDLVRGDLSAIPDGITHLLNFAVTKSGRWDVDLDGNVAGTALLMERCREAEAYLHCSSTAVYEPAGDEPLTERAPLGDNHRAAAALLPFMQTYSITKIASEGAARYGARRWQLPTTIARLSVPYGDNGGWPAVHLEFMHGGVPIEVHPGGCLYNPIHEDDLLATLPGLVDAAAVPPTVVNWGGPPARLDEWCRHLGALTGAQPSFNVTEQTIPGVCVDLTRMHELVGPARVDWRDGMRRMVEARRPDLLVT